MARDLASGQLQLSVRLLDSCRYLQVRVEYLDKYAKYESLHATVETIETKDAVKDSGDAELSDLGACLPVLFSSVWAAKRACEPIQSQYPIRTPSNTQ
jgi:hypothetical protein